MFTRMVSLFGVRSVRALKSEKVPRWAAGLALSSHPLPALSLRVSLESRLGAVSDPPYNRVTVLTFLTLFRRALQDPNANFGLILERLPERSARNAGSLRG
jgi:hypothetical protein